MYRSRTKPFPHIRETCSDTVKNENIKAGQGQGREGVKLDNKMNNQTGDEHLELLMLWKLEYQTHIANNDTIAPIAELNNFKQLVSHNAICAVEDRIEPFGHASNVYDTSLFCTPETMVREPINNFFNRIDGIILSVP